MSNEQFLELLYTEWNTGRKPKDAAYYMRSLSMSDIVYLYGHYYYCDRLGWKEIDPYKKTASKHAGDGDEKEDSFANMPRKPDDIATKEKDDICPLCDSPSFDGEYCNICGYQVPPEGFDDIKLEGDSDYEEYESDSDYEDDVDTTDEDVDVDEVEDADIEEDEGKETDEDDDFSFGYEDADDSDGGDNEDSDDEEDDIDESDSDDENDDDKDDERDKKKSASIMYDISDDPQTYIGIAEMYGDYDLIGFDIITTDDYDLQIELEDAGAIEI